VVFKILLLLVFFAVTIFVGLYFRKRAASVNDFVLGGRSVGPWLSAFSYGATYFSAVVFVGFAGQFGWRFGTAAVWIGLGNAFIGALSAWFVLGRRTRLMTNHLKSATMPEFFGKRYRSTAIKLCAAVIIFVFLIPYTASLYNGLSRLFSMAFEVDFAICIIVMAALTAIFVVAGGYIATAVNDFIQGTVMLVGIVAIIAAVLISNGGFTAAMTALAQVEGPGFAPGIYTSFFGPEIANLIGVIILTSLGAWGLPQMVARFYSIKSEKMIPKGALVSTVFALVIAGGCYFLGSFGRLYAGDIALKPDGTPIYDSIVPTMLSQFSDVMIGVVILMVFAASISTLSSLVMSSASTLTLDFLKGHVIKKMTDGLQLLIIRVLIVVFVVVSSVIAIVQYKNGFSFIANLMGVSWGAIAGSFLAPFLYGLYWKRVTKASVLACFIFCIVLMTWNVLISLNVLPATSLPSLIRHPINAGAFAMIAGLVIVPVVSWLTRRPEKQYVESCFSCYEEMVTVKVSRDLGTN